MKIRSLVVALSLAVAARFGITSTVQAADGADLNIHNETGHDVAVFLFTDGLPHTNEKGGVQAGEIKNHQSKVAHVPTCKFSVLLVDHEDIWHAEYKDCHATDLTFTADTGHDKKH